MTTATPTAPTADEVFEYELTTRESCEYDGTCDDSCSPPARADCLTETAPPAPPVELPHTGLDLPALLLAVGMFAALLGFAILRLLPARR